MRAGARLALTTGSMPCIIQARHWMGGLGVPPVLERRVLAWLDYESVATDEEEEGDEVVRRLAKAPALLGEVLRIAINHTQMGDISFISELKSSYKEAFTIEVYNRMVLWTCCSNTVLAKPGESPVCASGAGVWSPELRALVLRVLLPPWPGAEACIGFASPAARRALHGSVPHH